MAHFQPVNAASSAAATARVQGTPGSRNGLRLVLAGLLWAGVGAGPVQAAGTNQFFGIRVVDSATGRGVPLVELRTVSQVRYYTDSAGLVAFAEPGLMGREVWFTVWSHGYECPRDGFGNAGVRLRPEPGGRAEIKLKRINIAERLYRITGEGLYRDTVLLGEPAPIAEPVLNGDVVGQDSSVPALYHGHIYWFWGDTSRAEYPLGNFATAGATSELPDRGGLPPSQGVNLHYFTDANGFSRGMAPVPGGGPVWIEQPVVVTNDGREVMVTHYRRMKNLGTKVEQGLMIFDDGREQFVKVREEDLRESWRFIAGRPFEWRDAGTNYFVFARPFATVRVKADLASVTNPASYQAFTCLAPDSTPAQPRIGRDAQDHVVWNWQDRQPPLTQKAERELIRRGLLRPDEARHQLSDVDSGDPVEMQHASIHWNAFRQRWILIGVQIGGRSHLGEVWYAEATSPLGSWRPAKRIVTHEKYSFYNPAQLPFFDEAGGRYVYFEGTYSHTFSGNDQPTPRYDYNQLMYRLDLADPRLRWPTVEPGNSNSR
jgi:hypothetical protein